MKFHEIMASVRMLTHGGSAGLALFGLMLFGCAQKPAGYRVYVTNETSGDLTVIDSTTMDVVATIALGKRPRGIHASPDGKTIYVALSGSPFAPPGVDESKLPPPDKNADGIGVFDLAQNKLVKIVKSGSDPENFDISHDGKTLYVSNEDASGVSFLDIASGTITNTIKTGQEPEGVTLTPDGKLIYSTAEVEGTVSVIDAAAEFGRAFPMMMTAAGTVPPAAQRCVYAGRKARVRELGERRGGHAAGHGEERDHAADPVGRSGRGQADGAGAVSGRIEAVRDDGSRTQSVRGRYGDE